MIKLRTGTLRSPRAGVLTGLLAALLLAGCGSAVKLDETPVESRTPTVVDTAGAGNSASARGAGGSTGGAAQSQVATVNLAAAGGAGAAGAGSGAAGATGRAVYFDYDTFVVNDEFRGVVESHAKVLAANRGKRLVIEGHTDERGGREYNLALGQKRAEAVGKSLALLGATDAQIEAVSFGKERPAVEGHDEEAWARNRRAEVKDR